MPLLLTATVYIVLASPYLLPDRSGSMQKYIDNPREFTTTVRILAVTAARCLFVRAAVREARLSPLPVFVFIRTQSSPHVGKSLEQTGLLTMSKGTLYRVRRDKSVRRPCTKRVHLDIEVLTLVRPQTPTPNTTTPRTPTPRPPDSDFSLDH